MKILFDHQIFSYERFGGLSRYFIQLINHFHANNNCDAELPLIFSNNIYLRELDHISASPLLTGLHFSKLPGLLNILNLNHSKKSLSSQSFDVFHPTFYNPYFLKYIGNKPFVLTVYDMIAEIFPEMVPGQAKISQWKLDLIKKANKIIAISENTKKDIIRVSGIQEDKVDVVYLGTALAPDTDTEMLSFNLPVKYILFIGKRSFYKNFDRFIRAISYLLTMDNQLHLICTGDTAFTLKEKKVFKALDISDKVIHVHSNDQFLSTLYKNALAFVLPSLYEGFGLPVLEAFNCGCPAIISKISSLTEVGGKAVMYFNPEDESSIQDAVKKVIYDKSLRNILKQEGFERVRKFTWEQTAIGTLKVYKELCA